MRLFPFGSFFLGVSVAVGGPAFSALETAFLATFLVAFLATFLADFLDATFFFAMSLFGVAGTQIQESHYSKLEDYPPEAGGTLLEVSHEVKDFWLRNGFFGVP